MRIRSTAGHFAWLGVEIALVGLICFSILAIAWSRNVTFDMTPTLDHTLSDQAQRTARRLAQDVRITVFYNSQEQGRVREMKELLRRFADQSGHVSFRMVDLDRSPMLANQYNVVNYNTAIVESGDVRLPVRNLGEDDITTALIKLIEGRQRVAVFAVGHGEADPTNPDPRSGLTQGAKALESENYRIERMADLRGGIPDEVTLFVVANPRTDFTDAEIAAVDAYLERGGGGLFLVEAGSAPRLAGLLRELGIEQGNDLIVDERNRLFFADSFAPQIAFFNDQILPFTGAPPAVLPLAQSILPVDPSRDGVQVAPFAFTGQDTFAHKDRTIVEGVVPSFVEGVDLPGPVPVAAIARIGADETGGSVVVVGDGEFATNLYVGTLGNRDFFLNLAHLAGRAEALIATRHEINPGGTFSRLHLTAPQARVLFWVSVVLLPATVLLLGALIGWRRRARSAG
ncbi:GldG family protein [Candidatus Binatia bacterium]|nr:GldG family protein [Candidatus Binatia bacterium]